MKIKYDFNFDGKKIIISIQLANEKNKNKKNKNNWYLSEQWCEEEIGDKIILSKTNDKIVYTFSDKIPKFNDDRLYCYPVVRKDYVCFTGQIGLYIPDIVTDDTKEFTVEYSTNFPLFISGIGKIEKEKEIKIKTTMQKIKTQLFVLTKTFISFSKLIVTYSPESFWFLSLEDIARTVIAFLDNCYEFFDIQDNLTFVVNYVGMKVEDKSSTGYGGNGNYAGFNYLITNTEVEEEKINDYKIYVLHELFHHFNKFADYGANWFSEGFSEFFCRYLSLNDNDFIIEANKFIIEYMINPYRDAGINIMTRHNFWTNKFIEKLPYAKGFVYALYLYQKDKDIFLKNFKSIIMDIYDGKQISVTNKYLKKKLNDKNFDRYIIKGEIIELSYKKTEYLYRKIRLRTINIGFDLDYAINNKMIKNIDKNSDAYKKGVKDGKIDFLYINVSEKTLVLGQNHNKITVNIWLGNYIVIPQLKKRLI